jgi:DNA-binding NtrC family response regulator
MASGVHTVLVVDDDDGMRMLCRINLELDGYRVFEAATVDSAIEQLGERPVDVVLLDVHVGTGDGFGVLEHVDGNRVVLFTGSLDVEPSHRRRVGAVLTKPFTIAQLSKTVAGLTTGR